MAIPAEIHDGTIWRCHGCWGPLGQVVVDPGAPIVDLRTRQVAARLSVPVTWVCTRCGAVNDLAPADLERWRRRGGRQPLVAGVPRSVLARPA